ncbi:MAG: glutamate cyclase domain-containing protein [Candidatus Ranarchaeia archaeon]
MSKSEEDLFRISKVLEQISCLDVNGRHSYQLNEFFSQQFLNGKPLLLDAVEKMFPLLKPDANVLLLTGFPIRGVLENDGPIGTVVLIKLFQKMGVKCHVATIEKTENKLSNLYARSGLSDVPVYGVPINKEQGHRYISNLIEKKSPSILLSIEVPGGNRKGLYHNMHGENISSEVPDFDRFLIEAKKRKILCISIGDGGNELGLGKIREYVKKSVPYGATCKCSCNSGIASFIESDAIILSSVSNWASYALAGFISFIKKIPFSHSPLLERDLISISTKLGFVDSQYGIPRDFVDGIDSSINASVVDLTLRFLNFMKT